jgi:glyoxylase-like metal-dependent hydrolase (beta-lactamase superfamily II)
LNPGLQFYARDNYGEEIARSAAAPNVFGKSFFGERFSIDDVLSFKPDFTIDHRTELKIGGTQIELIPVQGGETHDAMLIHLPDYGVMFVGDFIMPYLGAPFVQEGDLQGCSMRSTSSCKGIPDICFMVTSLSRGISPLPPCWHS